MMHDDVWCYMTLKIQWSFHVFSKKKSCSTTCSSVWQPQTSWIKLPSFFCPLKACYTVYPYKTHNTWIQFEAWPVHVKRKICRPRTRGHLSLCMEHLLPFWAELWSQHHWDDQWHLVARSNHLGSLDFFAVNKQDCKLMLVSMFF